MMLKEQRTMLKELMLGNTSNEEASWTKIAFQQYLAKQRKDERKEEVLVSSHKGGGAKGEEGEMV